MKAVYAWVRKHEKNGLVGYADIRFALTPEGDGCLTIRNFPIFDSEDGLRVGMPSEKFTDKEGKPAFKNTVDIYFKDEDGQALMRDIKREVTLRFNGDSAPKPQSTPKSAPQTAADEGMPLPF